MARLKRMALLRRVKLLTWGSACGTEPWRGSVSRKGLRCLSGSDALHCSGCSQKDESKVTNKCIRSFLYAYRIQKKKTKTKTKQNKKPHNCNMMVVLHQNILKKKNIYCITKNKKIKKDKSDNEWTTLP